jgi:RNAse (barnase) inhibitor barstar
VRRIQDVWCMEGRNGDNLLCPFQCDLCHFRNIKKRDPFASDLKDLNMLSGIRRANFDAFWAIIPGTVKSNLTLMLRIVKVQEEAHGIPRGQMFRPQGHHPLEDTFGMMTSVVLIDRSLNAGINASTVQFNTIHKTWSAMSNYESTAAPEMRHSALVGCKKGERLGFTNTSVYSLWFDRFTVGFHVVI